MRSRYFASHDYSAAPIGVFKLKILDNCSEGVAIGDGQNDVLKIHIRSISILRGDVPITDVGKA